MKNLSSIPCLSLFEAFTILITLAVCLAGFTEAEVRSNLRKHVEPNYASKEAPMGEDVPYSHKTAKLSGDELHRTELNEFRGGSVEKLIKRQSDDFGESGDSEGERESDGYGYDDDEYYHLNYKRNDDMVGNAERNKMMSREGLGEMNRKEGLLSPPGKFSVGKVQKENDKEMQTIEMLNFKEFHPNIGGDETPNQNAAQTPKPLTFDSAHRKLPSSSVESLNMRDLRENSALEEKMKDRKDESGGMLGGSSSESKVAEGKKIMKTSEDKDGAKLKDAKIAEGPEKKEKEASLKDVKENVGAKSLKDSAKSSEEKDKNLKLNENAKLEENLEKLNAKSKEGETAKITKEEKENSKLAAKVSMDVINPNDISQISNRASFVSSDYKDNMEAMKPTAAEDDEKTSEDLNDSEKNVGLSEYEDLRERQLSLREQSGEEGSRQGAIKASDYLPFAASFEMKNNGENEYFKKRESWKDHGKFHLQQDQMQDPQQQQQQQQQQTPQEQAPFEHDVKNLYHLKFPPGELENTEYHKNFIKSLRRYKGLGENAKVLTPESTSFSSVEKSSFQEKEEPRKKKRSKEKKRRSMMSGEKDKFEGGHPKSRRSDFGSADRSEWYPAQQSRDSQELVLAKEDDSRLFDGKKTESSRQRRKSPAKLEYEIKIINQNQQESRNIPLSNLRMKKEVKIKLATDDKYLKKYPYSQVSREDLTRLSESEKKYKRKAPAWMRSDQGKESLIQTRGLPSGYYGNRVKFGQKNYARTEDKSGNEQSMSDIKLSYVQTPVEKSSFQRGSAGTWEVKSPDYKHDPMKRYDDTGMNSQHGTNSLLLIKKGQNGERIAKAFEEGKSKDQEDKIDTERLVKLLSKDNDYLILKKTDSNKYLKVTDSDTDLEQQAEVGASAQQNKKSSLEIEPQSKQSAKNKGVYIRSSRKEDKKYAGLHGAASKSNLKKTFDKFRDLADFFKDSEQESADSQYPSQEIKEGRDIVFSEDKLPDPIVISSDPSGKSDSLNQKPMNSIYSISTNFKHLDQQDRKEDAPKDGGDSNKNMLAAEVKSEGQDFSWEPALKNAFPEAKSINAMSKNGNEIIVLDFNRNQLKNEHGFLPMSKSNSKTQGMGNMGAGNGRLLNSLGQRQVEVVLPSKMLEKNRREEDRGAPIMSLAHQQGPYAVFGASDGQQVSIPLNQLNQLPYLFRTLAEKKQSASASASAKTVTKKSAKWGSQQNTASDNYGQFLKDLEELSEMNKKGKIAGRRSSDEVLLPASSFPELSSYSDVSVRKLGSLLQNILANPNVRVEGGSWGMVDNRNPGYLKGWYPAAYDARREQGQWVSSEDHGKTETKEDKEDSNSYQTELWEELARASNEMRRQRREETGSRKSPRDSRSPQMGGLCPADMQEKCIIKLGSERLESKEEAAGEKLSSEEDRKESEERSKAVKSDYEGHLNELFENLSSEKNQKDLLNIPNESTPNRGKRKETDRGKRSSRRDVKNKVSTTEVQNKILKNLPEDNYPSVYSPGIKRRLLSTGNEAEDGADERERSEMAKGGEANWLKNDRNKCVDPMILELFGVEAPAGEKNRDRRSVSGGFHSNFKREIDLDESMPNDFQNFLVTSLGGVGSQKREVVKKEEALWEGKESGQNGYNQIVDSSPGGKDAGEDSALEKREVSSGEKQKGQKYKSGSYFGTGTQSDAAGHSQMARSEGKSSIETKASQYENKVPTQIRIQITNAGEKEKKSAKASDETSPIEVENASKDKDLFDKDKIGQLNALPKLHQFSKSKYSPVDYEDGESGDTGKQKPFGPRPCRRRRRKKKKYVPENPMKPIKDFIAFDQKAMEILLRKYMADQNLANQPQTTQKVPMSNHLPQVETVYNPTQGTNKAQLDASRITKINSISNKNGETAKNNLQSNDASAYDEGILRSFLKDKTSKAKTDKAYGKEYEDVDWKPYLSKSRLRTDVVRDSPVGLSFQNMKNYGGDVVSSLNHGINAPASRAFSPYPQSPYYQKWQSPYNNYFYHPPNMNVVNSNSFYDALKLKQELKNHGLGKGMMKDYPKTSQKPYYYNDGSIYGKVEEKDRNPNFPTTAEPTWNYDYSFNKKPFSQKLKSRDFYSSGIKSQVDSRTKATYPAASSKFIKNMDDEKLFDATQLRSLDSSKDCDYLDVLDEDYPEDESGKDLQFDEPIVTDVIKKNNKLYDPGTYHHTYSYYKASDVDGDGNADSDDEFEDDYDETADDDDLDDYSLLANSRDADPELGKSSHALATFQGNYHPDDTFSHLSSFYPRSSHFELKGNSFEQTEYNNPKTDDKFQQGRQALPLVDLKTDIDPLTGSSSLLKKANENTNIFGKNLLKNLNKYSYDDNWRHQDKTQDDKPITDLYPRLGRKLKKRKMDWQKQRKRNQDHTQIGSRIFYVAKTEMADRNDNPHVGTMQSVSRRHDPGIPLLAQFAAPADADADFDSESNANRVNGIGDDLDVEDNPEDDGTDSVLENVIGKYIMRKRVHSSPGKRLRKRSADAYRQKPRKVLRKRLSSGHLTENNFKKFHKKNFTGKRDVGHIARRAQAHRKRSALDLFKRITSKDRDSKKVDDSESRSAGFEPLLLLSDKKSEGPAKDTGDASGPQMRKFEDLNLPLGTEPSGLKEGAAERKKEKARLSIKADGPWKLELNDRFEGPGREWSLADVARNLEEKESPKAYFAVRKSGRRAKRKCPGALPPTAGSSQTEVGTSHIRKRSLEPSTGRTKSPRRDASPSEPTTENPLTVQQHNRALHDTQSLSEGDSKPRAPHVLQRNSNKNESFVADDERPPRFSSTGKLTNLKSVFPPPPDANIIRDSRDINEGTSEYLGQQIVEAILSHVSSNPKFKDVIAPGLTMRVPQRREPAEEKRTPHQPDFNEQLQSFLQKFMFDLQKLAENHVRRRMCNQIDKQSKAFLQALLSKHAGRNQNTIDDSETSCSGYEDVSEPPPPSTAPPPPLLITQQPEPPEEVLAGLRRKQCLLKKLIDEYQSLSKLQQETLNVNYRYLKQELDETNKELDVPSGGEPCLACGFEPYEVTLGGKGKKSTKKKPKKTGFENTSDCSLGTPKLGGAYGQLIPVTPEPPPTTTTQDLPCFYFDPAEGQNADSTTPNSSDLFENVYLSQDFETTSTPLPTPKNLPSYAFDPQYEIKNRTTFQKKPPNEEEEVPQCEDSTRSSQTSLNSPTASFNEFTELVTTPTPQSFDLLPPTTASTTDVLHPNLASERVRIKQSAPKDGSSDSSTHPTPTQSSPFANADSLPNQPALHRLNTGDAAGLQLSLKTRGPWVSTLDFAKNFRNVPKDFLTLPKARLAGNDAPFSEGFKSARASIAPSGLSLATPSRAGYYHRPVFPYRIDKKFFAHKQRPFSKVTGVNKEEQNNCQMLPFQYFLRKYPIPQNRVKILPCTHGVRRKKRRRSGNGERRRGADSGEPSSEQSGSGQ